MHEIHPYKRAMSNSRIPDNSWRNPFVENASHSVYYDFNSVNYNYSYCLYIQKALKYSRMLKSNMKFGESSDWKNQANVWPWLDLDGSGPTERRRRLRFITSPGSHLEAATNRSTLISAKAVNKFTRTKYDFMSQRKRPRIVMLWIMNLGFRTFVL